MESALFVAFISPAGIKKSVQTMRFYAYLPSDCHLSTTEVEAFVAILGPHVDNVDKVFVKTGAHKDANTIRVGFF